MKKFVKTMVLLFALFLVPMAASASDTTAQVQQNEVYAHPTMFGAESVQVVSGEAQSVYVIGEKIAKPQEVISVNGKSKVLVSSWVKDVLNVVKTASNSKNFNIKAPIRRSEMAVVMVEGLSDKANTKSNSYLDISNDYWAKSWIDMALNDGIMIGYPDNKFRPDQKITKAEVFATIAQLISVPTDKSLIMPTLNGYKMEQIPDWAFAPTKEVLASGIMDGIPDVQSAAKNKYLSKEQVAYIVAMVKQKYGYNKSANSSADKYVPTYLNVKLNERLDARHSNIGDTFTATTTKAVTILGKAFPVGSIVKGEVVAVKRPGFKCPGYIKVKFNSVNNGDVCVNLPKTISSAKAKVTKNTNGVARVFAYPFSTVARVGGVAGRTISSVAVITSNDFERYGDNWSNAVADLASLKGKSSLRCVGKSFVTIGNYVVDPSN